MTQRKKYPRELSLSLDRRPIEQSVELLIRLQLQPINLLQSCGLFYENLNLKDSLGYTLRSPLSGALPSQADNSLVGLMGHGARKVRTSTMEISIAGTSCMDMPVSCSWLTAGTLCWRVASRRALNTKKQSSLQVALCAYAEPCRNSLYISMLMVGVNMYRGDLKLLKNCR